MPRGFGAKCEVVNCHSGKPRAQQTADCVAEVLGKHGCTVSTAVEASAEPPLPTQRGGAPGDPRGTAGAEARRPPGREGRRRTPVGR